MKNVRNYLLLIVGILFIGCKVTRPIIANNPGNKKWIPNYSYTQEAYNNTHSYALVAIDTDGSQSNIIHDFVVNPLRSVDMNSEDTINMKTQHIYATDIIKWNTNPIWSNISSKPSFATVATSGSYLDLSNKPTIPTISGSTGIFGAVTTSNGLVTSGKRMETYSGTTNSSGVYTVTFGTAYSVAPNIQATISNQSSTNQYIRISSATTTGFTINAYSFSTNTLLGIVNLISTTTNINGANIDVLVTEK